VRASAGHLQIVESALRPRRRPRLVALKEPARRLSRWLSEGERRLSLLLLAIIGASGWLHASRSAARRVIIRPVARLAVSARLIDEAEKSSLFPALNSSDIAFDVLTARKSSSVSARPVLNDLALLPPALRKIGVKWLEDQSHLRDELPRTVYNGLVDEPATAGTERLDFMLLLIQRIATGFSDPQAMGLLQSLWTLSSAMPNPYDRSSLNLSASNALIHLIATRPEVESKFIEDCKNYRGNDRRLALDLLARTVRRRGVASSKSFLKLNAAIDMSHHETDRFASIADVAQRTAARSSERTRRPEGSLVGRSMSRLGVAVTIAYAPIAVVAVLWATDLRSPLIDKLPFAEIPLEVSLALLALIATLNVFTVQLSTTRLPATVARVSGQPWQLAGAYSSAIVLVATTALAPEDPPPLWQLLEVALMVSSFAWLGGALARIFRRTDAAEACKDYVDRYIHRWNSAGKRFGTEQWRAAQLSRGIEALPFANIGSGEILGHDVVRIEAAARGLFVPNHRNLRRSLADGFFEHGGFLQFAVGFGRVVPMGDTVAWMRPPAGQRVQDRLFRRLTKGLRPRGASDVENVSTQAITLSSFALETAKLGDTRLAETIAEQASMIVSSHMSCIRRQRAKLHGSIETPLQFDEQNALTYPVTPVLRDIISLVVARAGESERVGGVADILVARCLTATGPSEQTPIILASLLSSAGPNSLGPERFASWLRQAGIRALAMESDIGFGMATQELGKLASKGGQEAVIALRSLAALSAASMRLRPSQFRISWSEVSDWTSSNLESIESVRVPLHVGSAAMESGSFTAALACVRSLRTPAQRLTLQKLTDHEHVFIEARLAEATGLYLSQVPTDALERFRDFAASVVPAAT
jgi:hypothetical protein